MTGSTVTTAGRVGQSAFFRLVPDKGVAVALLTNGGDTPALYDELVGHVLRETAGIDLPKRLVPPSGAGRDLRRSSSPDGTTGCCGA